MRQSSSDLRLHPGSSQETLGSILATFAVQMKSSVNILRDFCRLDLHFAQNPEFRRKVALQSVREGLIVSAFKYLITFGKEVVKDPNYDSITWLLLSKLYFDIEMTTVEFMVRFYLHFKCLCQDYPCIYYAVWWIAFQNHQINNVEDDFQIGRSKKREAAGLTDSSVLKASLKETATFLVQEFVALEGSQFTLVQPCTNCVYVFVCV